MSTPQSPSEISQPPRCLHYTFAHVTLRQFLFNAPVSALTLMVPTAAQRIIGSLWPKVTGACNDAETDTMTLDQLRYFTHELDERPCVVIQMPPEVRFPEAYFIAVVILNRWSNLQQATPVLSKTSLRYFTLECTGDPELGTLGEWLSNGEHIMHPLRNEPTLEGFIEIVNMALNEPLPK